MLCKLIIESERIEEIQDALRRILESKDPIPADSERGIRLSKPDGDLPVALRPEPRIPEGSRQVHGKTEHTELPTEEVHCATCGKLFIRRTGRKKPVRHCSKHCYMQDWHDRKMGQSSKAAKDQKTEPEPKDSPVIRLKGGNTRGMHGKKTSRTFMINDKETLVTGTPE